MRGPALLFTLASVLSAQTPTQAPPLAVHRQLPSDAELQKSLELLTQAQAQLPTEQQQPAQTLPNLPPAPPAVAQPAPAQTAPEEIPRSPRGWKPTAKVALPVDAQKAVTMARSFVDKPAAPVQGSDGRIQYVYGAGLPTIVCAPLRLCAIELEPGERLSKEPPLASDAVRWDIIPRAVGIGDSQQSIVLLRPLESGLDADLLITTDRRSYYLRIVSDATEYMARVSFVYQTSTAGHEWADYQKQLADLDQQKAEHAAQIAPVEHLERRGYLLEGKKSWTGKEHPHPYFWPTDVYDDGTFVRIVLPEIAAKKKGPTLMAVGPNGLTPMNWHLEGTHTLVANELFDKAALVDGTGKHEQIVTIIAPVAPAVPEKH